MKAVVFHNPKAGKKGHDKEAILAALKLADHSARYVSTKSDDFKKELEKVEADFVVVAGGDGTVAEVIAHLGNHRLPIGILPMGTANNIARSLAIAGEPQIIVETWRMDRTQKLDIALAQGPWGASPFVEAFGIGLLPDMILKANKKDKEKGALNLKKGRELLCQIVRDAKPLKLEVMVDSRKLDGDWLGVEVMNIPYTGPGLPLAPKAGPDDGMLELVCFEKEKADELCTWFEAPADKLLPATTRRGKLITLTWRDASHRVDDAAYKAEEKEKVVTLHCGEERALILESHLNADKNSSERMVAAK
jgi:diacylglycerol kinase family enzyme